MSLLVAIVYWIGIACVACGVVLFLGFAWFYIDECVHPVDRYSVPPRPIRMTTASLDWADPLEQAFSLPAVEPRRRV